MKKFEDKIIIRRDWIYVTLFAILMTLLFVAAFFFFKSINHRTHFTYHGRLLFIALPIIPFFWIKAIVCIITYKNRYVEITNNGIDDKSSYLFGEYIPFNAILNLIINRKKRCIIIELKNGTTKTIPELKITELIEYKINNIYNNYSL